MVPRVVLLLLLSGFFLQAGHNPYHVTYGSDKDLTQTIQDGTRYVAPNLFTANKYAYAPDAKDPFAINGFISLNAGGPSPYSVSSGSGREFALDQKTCGLLTVTTKQVSRFTFLCRESTYSFELATSLSKLTPSFSKAGYSQLVLGMDDIAGTLFVLNSNTPVSLVQTVFRHFFDEGASTSIPAACEISLSSDLKFLLLSCDLSKLNQGGPGTASQPRFTPVAESKGTLIRNPGPLAQENPLATPKKASTEQEADLNFDSDVFPKQLFWAVPFAPDDEFEGTKVYDLCNAQLLDQNDDHGLRLKLLRWVRSIKESKEVQTVSEGSQSVSGKECSGLISPIENPRPRIDNKGDYWYNARRPVSSSNPDGHHEGVDIKGTLHTTPVIAPIDGIIQDYGAGGACGVGVLIKHDCLVEGKTFWTKYCHLSDKKALPFKPGQRIKKGDLLGYVGNSGNANDPEMATHLHVEYLAGGELSNKYLAGAKDFDPVAKGFLPKTLAKPSAARTEAASASASLFSSPSALSFATLKLPTIAQYVSAYFTNVVYDVDSNPCGSDSDANGFFGMRNRKLGTRDVQACAHAGIDLRGNRKSGGAAIYSQPVKAMLPGKITRIKKGYQSGWNDYVVVVDSGEWVVSYGHIRVVNTLREGQPVTEGQVVGYPFRSPDASGANREFQTTYGGELDVKVLYKGTDPALRALTVKELKKNTAYARFFTPNTLAVFRGADFTFNVPNYDDYFLWEKYAGTESSRTPPSTQTPPSGPGSPSTPPSPSSGPTVSNPPSTQPPSQTVGAKGPFSDKPLLCIFYSTDKKYEDLVFHLIRKDSDGEKVIRQKRCTYSEDDPSKTPGRTVACNEQNDAGFHTIFWDARYAEYNPSRTGEYLDRGKTYFVRMIGSVIQNNRKTVEQIGGHSFIQSAKGMYHEDVDFGNLELSLKNKALPIKVFVDGALVAFSAQDELSISVPVGKHRLNVCKFDAEVQIGSTPLKKEIDCQGFSYASASSYSSDAAKAFVEEARTWIGTPYQWTTPSKGPNGAADCSGLVYGAYNNIKARFKHAPLSGQFCSNGNLPRTADMQFGCLRSTGNLVKSWNEVQPGDLIFQLNTYNGGGAGQPACTFQVASSGLTDTSNPACVMACDLQQASTRIALTADPKNPGKYCGVPTHVFIAVDKPQLDAGGKPIYVRAIEASGHGSFVKEIENRDIRGYNLLVGRIPWISSGGSAPVAGPQTGQCNEAALSAALSQFGLNLQTTRNGRSIQRDLNDWKTKIAAYSSRHYGDSEWQLKPSVIVEHYTATSDFTRELIDSATRDGETPGVASHFEVEGKNIYQILPLNVRSRGAFGVNHVAINIEMVAKDAAQLAQRPETLDTGAKLTKALMAACGIPLEKVYSHEQLNDGVRGVPEYKDSKYADYGDQRKSDPGEQNMRTIRAKIQSLPAVAAGNGGSGSPEVKKKSDFREVLATTYCIGESGVGGVGATAGGRIQCPDRASLFVALPAPIDQLRGKKVEVCFQSRCATAPVEDVGPWCTNDGKYVFEGATPFSETLAQKTPQERKDHGCAYSSSNGAGIDLSLALAKSIGYPGSPNKVRWRFTG